MTLPKYPFPVSPIECMNGNQCLNETLRMRNIDLNVPLRMLEDIFSLGAVNIVCLFCYFYSSFLLLLVRMGRLWFVTGISWIFT